MTHLVEVVQDVTMAREGVCARIVGAADCATHGVVDVRQPSQQCFDVCCFDLDELCRGVWLASDTATWSWRAHLLGGQATFAPLAADVGII